MYLITLQVYLPSNQATKNKPSLNPYQKRDTLIFKYSTSIRKVPYLKRNKVYFCTTKGKNKIMDSHHTVSYISFKCVPNKKDRKAL